jgi:[acyl-carrier-protein] S-malonyltransferase
MKAYLFPGQGSQFEGMGKDLYDKHKEARGWFIEANRVLGFELTDIMFNGSAEDLKQTKVTQPAIFLYSVVQARLLEGNFQPAMVAGHSLGEISALVSVGAIDFCSGVRLVNKRAQAMQRACEAKPSTMAAILGLADEVVEKICSDSDGIVVAANYNSPGQLVISGEWTAVEQACAKAKEAGARRAMILPVGGAFHSPMMEMAREELALAIEKTEFSPPMCAVYQNVTAQAERNPTKIQENLIEQLTAPVRWTQSVQNMIADGATAFIDVGPGKVLQGLVRKINREVEVSGVA